MSKKVIVKKLLLLAVVLSSNLINNSCSASLNCSKVGYGQEFHGSYIDDKTDTAYFIYSYLESKDKKNLAFYKIDFSGKYEKIVDLGIRNEIFNGNTKYKFYTKMYSDNRVLIKTYFDTYMYDSKLGSSEKDSFYYFIDLKDNKLIYKTKTTNTDNFSNYFSIDNKFLLENDGESKTTIFDVENNTYINIPDSENKTFGIEWSTNSNHLIRIDMNYDSNSKITTYTSLIIYEVKDKELKPVSYYDIPESESNIFSNANNFSLDNNKLNFEGYTRWENNSGTKYSFDLTDKTLLLKEKNLPRVSPTYTELPNVTLKASKNLYLDYRNEKDKPLLDYLNELPKSFYSEQVICHPDYRTMNKL